MKESPRRRQPRPSSLEDRVELAVAASFLTASSFGHHCSDAGEAVAHENGPFRLCEKSR